MTNRKYSIMCMLGFTVLSVHQLNAQRVTAIKDSIKTSQDSTSQLDEVVVTALGVKRERRSLGYAIQNVNGTELTRSNEQNFLNSMSGKVSGLQITSSGGAVGSSTRVVLRGNNSFGGMRNQPLFVVDGIPMNNYSSEQSSAGAVDYGNAISDLDPNNIASISVLKGANAAALYGYLAANGVVIITTKNGEGLGNRRTIDVSSGASFEKMYILPHYQNSYGQGLSGDEYTYSLNGNGTSYQDYAATNAFTYLNGRGNGVNDGTDESWGPRLDAGLNLAQFNSPLDANGNRIPTPWISHPNNTKDFFQTGYTINNSVALTTSSNTGSTRFSLGQQKQVGTIPNTDQKRYDFSLNTIQNISSRLKATASITYLRLRNDNLVGQGYNSNNPMQSLGGWFGRQVDMQDLKAHWQETMDNGYPYNWNSNYHDNPYFNVNRNTHSRLKDRTYGSGSFIYTQNNWLKITLRGGGDFYTENRKEIVWNGSNATMTGTAEWNGGTFNYWDNKVYSYNADLILNGQGTLSKDLTLSYTAGANYLDQNQETSSLGANALTVPNLFTISNANGTISSSMNTSHNRSNSIYGQASLGFRNELYLDLTARNDWNSTLPRSNWSYFYPSASLSWIFTQDLIKNHSILNFGKLRTSWAKVGNGTSPYQLQSTYSAATSPYDGTTLYSLSTVLPPLGLKPESQKSWEVGTELGFFNNRIHLDATYYNKTTSDQIMSVNISGTTGYTSMLVNGGEIANHGIELQLGLKLLENPTGLNWNMDINWAKNKSKVNKLFTDPNTGQTLESYNLTSVWSLNVDAIPGEAFGAMRGAHFQRNESGAIEVGSNGLPLYSSTPEVLGNVTPNWTGGINNTFTFKNFSLNFLVDFRKGGDIFSVTQWFGYQSGVLQATVDNGIRENGLIVGKDVLQGQNVVKEDGSPNDIRVTAQDYFHSLWGGKETGIIDGSYIKLRTIQFSYGFPKSVGKAIPILKNGSISAFAQNVALLHVDKSNVAHIDPETGMGVGNGGLGIEQYQIPSNRSIGLKLNLQF